MSIEAAQKIRQTALELAELTKRVTELERQIEWLKKSVERKPGRPRKNDDR